MEYKLGAIFSGVNVRDYQMVCAASDIQFPESFELPTVRIENQMMTGSCVAHAPSSIIEYYNVVQRNDPTEMSVGYIYGNRTNSEHKDPGMIMRDALESRVKANKSDVAAHADRLTSLELKSATALSRSLTQRSTP